VPDVVTRTAHKLYRKSSAVTDLEQFPARGHSLTVHAGWSEIATASLDWLAKQGVLAR
jgi:non-heme chloroperoxidase